MPDDLDPIRARHRRYPVAMSQAMRDGRTLLALLDAAMAREARLREALAAIARGPCLDYAPPDSCDTRDGTGLWCDRCLARAALADLRLEAADAR